MKTTIIKLDFGDTDYFVCVNKNSFDEIYNPYLATKFNNIGDAKKWVDKNTTFTEYAKFIDHKEAEKKFDEWVNGGYVRRTLPLTDNILSRKYNGESALEVLNWWIKCKNSDDDLIRYEDYKTWPILNTLYKHIFDIEKYHDRDDKNLYITFQLYFKKNSLFSDFIKELKLVFDHVTLLDEESGYRSLSIFDHFLSEYGNSVNLLICEKNLNKKTRAKIVDRYGYYIVDGTLFECFNYLKQERYYE